MPKWSKMIAGDFAMCIFSFCASLRDETALETQRAASLASREAGYRYFMTGCIKVWVASNVEQIRLWDVTVVCLIVEPLRYAVECGWPRTERWGQDGWRVLIMYLVPLVVIIMYRGEL